MNNILIRNDFDLRMSILQNKFLIKNVEYEVLKDKTVLKWLLK